MLEKFNNNTVKVLRRHQQLIRISKNYHHSPHSARNNLDLLFFSLKVIIRLESLIEVQQKKDKSRKNERQQ